MLIFRFVIFSGLQLSTPAQIQVSVISQNAISLVHHDLTHDGHGCHGQGGRHAGPVQEERDVARLGPE